MIDLKILKQERQQVRIAPLGKAVGVCMSAFNMCWLQCPLAVASWDSSAHDNTSLNITTGNNERVYIILKVRPSLVLQPSLGSTGGLCVHRWGSG